MKKHTKESFLLKVRNSNLEMFNNCDYSVTNYVNTSKKVEVLCKIHGIFSIWPGDHMAGMHGCKECIQTKRKKTNLEKYGVNNYFKKTDRIKQHMLYKYGVTNPGLMPDHLAKLKKTNKIRFGHEWATQSSEIKLKQKNTNNIRYGFDYPMMNQTIKDKSITTKVNNGSFGTSNSSSEASTFILDYIKNKKYHISQCAFQCAELGVHEWGIKIENKWILYDLVVFDFGHRGNKNKIIEILEYHGPFHYTLSDSQNRGNDNAFPWTSNNTTIRESYNNDQFKRMVALSLTTNFTIIWANKYHEGKN